LSEVKPTVIVTNTIATNDDPNRLLNIARSIF